jgi:hypothetical protein
MSIKVVSNRIVDDDIKQFMSYSDAYHVGMLIGTRSSGKIIILGIIRTPDDPDRK